MIRHDLRAIGFWAGPDTSSDWPEVEQFVDAGWDEDERDFVATYLAHGVVARLYMGHSTCRICGLPDNGNSELSDGTFVWPSGFAHYVVEHGIRPPEEFVTHAHELSEQLFGERDETWWASFRTT